MKLNYMATTSRPQKFIGKNYLRFISILSAMGAIGLLAVVLFDVHLYPKFVTDWYKYLDFRRGIPVEAQANLNVSDTSIVTYNKDGDSIINMYPITSDVTKSIQRKQMTSQESNSVLVGKKLVTKKGEEISDVAITGMQISRAELYLQTDKLSYRLYFGFPSILTFIAASFCFWLLGGLVSDIQKGSSFGKTNWQRLQNIGRAIVVVQIVYLVMDLFAPLLGKFNITLTNTIAGQQSSFDFKADPVLPFSSAWALIGILVLTIASAFKEGEFLQEDKNSIV